MYDGGYDPKNPFPHDGEGKEPCTGYGCDCDEKNYGSYHHSKGTNMSGKTYCIWFIIAMIVGYGINELLGVIIMLILIFIMIVS